jgi:hypothetical protein
MPSPPFAAGAEVVALGASAVTGSTTEAVVKDAAGLLVRSAQQLLAMTQVNPSPFSACVNDEATQSGPHSVRHCSAVVMPSQDWPEGVQVLPSSQR